MLIVDIILPPHIHIRLNILISFTFSRASCPFVIKSCPLHRPPSEAGLFEVGPLTRAWLQQTELTIWDETMIYERSSVIAQVSANAVYSLTAVLYTSIMYTVVPALGDPRRERPPASLSMPDRHISTLNYLRSAATCNERTLLPGPEGVRSWQVLLYILYSIHTHTHTHTHEMHGTTP